MACPASTICRLTSIPLAETLATVRLYRSVATFSTVTALPGGNSDFNVAVAAVPPGCRRSIESTQASRMVAGLASIFTCNVSPSPTEITVADINEAIKRIGMENREKLLHTSFCVLKLCNLQLHSGFITPILLGFLLGILSE